METITVEKNGVRREMGVIQWNHLTNNGKKSSYDGWVAVDADSPIAEFTGEIPSEVAGFKKNSETVTPAEVEALAELEKSINGAKKVDAPTENFTPTPKAKSKEGDK